jgi:predicted acetyltransferase
VDIEIRSVRPDELAEFVRVEHIPFGAHVSNEDVEAVQTAIPDDRRLAAFEDGRMVATAGDWAMELTLPGLTSVPAPGVTAVGVLPTHRRRGLLTAMMRRQLDDFAEGGQPVAVLTASEGAIYGRFGYGLASTHVQVELDRAETTFRPPVEPEGRFTLLDKAGALAAFPPIFDRHRAQQPGELSRSQGWWQLNLRDPEWSRDGASPFFHVVYEGPEGDGYASYRMKENWDGSVATHTLRVVHLVATSPAARLALWRYCLGVDLVATVVAENCPLDEALRWRLADPRRMRVSMVADWLWVRLVDIPAGLAARRYQAEGAVVFDVADAFCPQNEGCYQLQGGPAGATCDPTTAAPDLALSAADLGAAYLGGVRFSTLARAGRVDELTPGALARADAMFASEPLPWCETDF